MKISLGTPTIYGVNHLSIELPYDTCRGFSIYGNPFAIAVNGKNMEIMCYRNKRTPKVFAQLNCKRFEKALFASKAFTLMSNKDIKMVIKAIKKAIHGQIKFVIEMRTNVNERYEPTIVFARREDEAFEKAKKIFLIEHYARYGESFKITDEVDFEDFIDYPERA